MGLQPLNIAPKITDLCNWLIQKGTHNLVDIYSWDTTRNWSNWALQHPPDWMLPQLHQLLVKLNGMAPMHLQWKDKWGWGKTGAYSARLGFASLQEQHHQIQTTNLRQHVWDPFGLSCIKGLSLEIIQRKEESLDPTDTPSTARLRKRSNTYSQASPSLKKSGFKQ